MARQKTIALVIVGLALVINVVLLTVYWDQPPSPQFPQPRPVATPVAVSEAPAEAFVSHSSASPEPELSFKTWDITFPDGDVMTIPRRGRFRPHKRFRITTPEERAVMYQATNEGEAEAEYRMYQFLTYCSRDYKSQSELDKAIEQLHQTHTVPDPRLGRDTNIEAEDYREVETQMRERFERCADISEAQSKKAGRWLKTAADNGYPSAMMVYALEHWGEDRALEYLEAAWLAGDSSAPTYIAQYYREPTDLIPHTQQPDKIAAYAYAYLGTKLWEMRLTSLGNWGEPRIADLQLCFVAAPFAEFRQAFPKRGGSQPWKRAEKAISARLKEGHTWQEIADGVTRYAGFCEATKKIGSETVMQAATFCGPDKHFLNDWEIPTDGQSYAERMAATARDS